MPAPVPAPGSTPIPTAMARPPAALQVGHAVPGAAPSGQAQPPAAEGLQAHGKLMLVSILRDLQIALSMFPTGTNEHKRVMKALQEVSEVAPGGQSTADLTIRQLMQAAQHIGRTAQLGQALAAHQQAASAQGAMPMPGV